MEPSAVKNLLLAFEQQMLRFAQHDEQGSEGISS